LDFSIGACSNEDLDVENIHNPGPIEYREKVESISDLFALRGKNRFRSENCAVYVVGRFQFIPIVMFGVNPGYSQKNNPVEEM